VGDGGVGRKRKKNKMKPQIKEMQIKCNAFPTADKNFSMAMASFVGVMRALTAVHRGLKMDVAFLQDSLFMSNTI
jgi:hypothetical protein